MDGGDDTLCKDSLTPYDQTDGGTCTFVAVMIGYFGLAMSFWWFCNIVHLFLRVGVLDTLCGKSSRRTKPVKRQGSNNQVYGNYWKYYSVLSFGAPVICMIALASADTFGYFGPLPYCFTTDRNEWVTWTFFHGLLIALYVRVRACGASRIKYNFFLYHTHHALATQVHHWCHDALSQCTQNMSRTSWCYHNMEAECTDSLRTSHVHYCVLHFPYQCHDFPSHCSSK